MLISKCCGKGFVQAARLVNALNEQGLVYNLHKTAPRKVKSILEQFGIDYDIAQKKPHVYIDDIIFTAECLNDDEFLKSLVDKLALCNSSNVSSNVSSTVITVVGDIDE